MDPLRNSQATYRPLARASGVQLPAPAGGAGSEEVHDAYVAADERPYLDRGEESLTRLAVARGLDLQAFAGKDVRGLAALVGRGLVNTTELEQLLDGLEAAPETLPALLAGKRGALVAVIARDHGIRVEDGKGRWSVQELANLDYLLSQLPPRFLGIVRQGPPLRREAESTGFTGLYHPFEDRVTLYNGVNAPDDAPLAAVKAREGRMRGTMLMEIGHAWQIRQAAPTNPGLWGVVKGLIGVVWRQPDFISEFAALAGWTTRPKWSIGSLFRPTRPDLSSASGALSRVSFSVLGRRFDLDLTGLRFDPAKEGTMISAYAKTDPYEDFGESLIAYFSDPAVLRRRAPEKYAYIRDRVLEGREYGNAYGLYQ